jgi:hypothetical protein
MNAEYPFLNDYPVPDDLRRIYKYLEEGNPSGQEFFVPKRGHERIKSLVGDVVSEQLVPIFTMANGGVIAAWILSKESELSAQPIVWMDSEGSPSEVIATNINALIALLHHYLGSIYDVIFANQMHAEDPDLFRAASAKFPGDEFLRMTSENWQRKPELYEFHLWLEKNISIPMENDPVKSITEATQAFPSFQQLVNEEGG